MLGGVKFVGRDEAERLEKADRKKKHRDKKKNKKKEKKQKKSSCHHSDDSAGSSDDGGDHRSRRPHNDDSDDSAGPDDAWQRDLDPQQQPSERKDTIQREDWMSMPMQRAIDGTNEPPLHKKEPSPDPDRQVIHARELNPHFRDGEGTGLPPSDTTTTSNKDPLNKEKQQQQQAVKPGTGDGGASWRMKALKRAQGQAAEQGFALKDVVAERWGSLGDLTAAVTENRPAHAMAHSHAARDRKGGNNSHHERHRDNNSNDRDNKHHHRHRDSDHHKDGNGGRDSKYLQDVRSSKAQMKRPQQPESLSWRRKEGQQPQSDSDAHTHTTKEHNRDNKGDHRAPYHQRDGDRSNRDNKGGDREYRERRQQHHSRDRDNVGLGRRDDAAVLKSVAAEINAFSNDGSFMDQFKNPGAVKDRPPLDVVDGEDHGGEQQPMEVEREQQQEEEEERRPREQQTTTTHYAPRPPKQQPTKANLSAAAMLKYRLLGKAPPPQQQQNQPQHEQEETVVLPLVDASGRAVPGAFGREAAGAQEAAAKGGKKVERYEGGEKKRYFADDDNVDLATLVKRTKYEKGSGGGMDIDKQIASGIAKRAKFKEGDLDADNEYDNDAGIDMLDKRPKKKRGTDHVADQEKQRQIRDYNRYTNAVDRCQLCFTSKSRPKHLTIAIGTSVYLAIPARGRLVPGHVQIIPAEHTPSTRIVDESIWTEIRNFKKCLIQMFMKQGMDVVFMETAMGLGDARSHAVVDCIPIPRQAAAKAPMYFKAAIDEVTSEWSQHHSKRLIDTKAKGLRGSIPPNFPYLNVEFGISDGFVHVIDNENKFDKSLGRSVIIGLLKLPPEDAHRQAKRESEALQSKWVAEFREQFDEFDWTKML